MRLPQENENCQWPQGRQQTTSTRPQEADAGIIGISGNRFPKAVRILERRNFLKIMKAGTKISGSSIVIFYRRKESGLTRLGITISKKHGKAHDRNYFKRLVREAFRLSRTQLPDALEINVQPVGKNKAAYSLPAIMNDFGLFSQRMKTLNHLCKESL